MHINNKRAGRELSPGYKYAGAGLYVYIWRPGNILCSDVEENLNILPQKHFHYMETVSPTLHMNKAVSPESTMTHVEKNPTNNY